MTKLRSADQAYRIGIETGRFAADMLRIEIVAAVYLDYIDMLDESCRPHGPFHGPWNDELRTHAGEFAEDVERGWWDGLKSRCSDIIEWLNDHSAARLPAEVNTPAADG